VTYSFLLFQCIHLCVICHFVIRRTFTVTVDATVQSTTAPSTKLHSTVDRPASLAPTSQTASGGIITTMPGRRDVPPAPVNSQNNLRLSVLRESFENSEPSVNSRRSTMDEGSDRNNDGDKVTASPRPPARPDSDT
jgi:hypothetical protein